MIKTIKVRNFKSISNATVDFPQFGAIVGQNGAGKSNLIQAISIAKELTAGVSIADVLGYKDIPPDEFFCQYANSLEANFSFELEIDESIFELSISVKGDENNRNSFDSLQISHEHLKVKKNENYEYIYHREFSTLKDENDKDVPLDFNHNELALSLYKNPRLTSIKQFFSSLSICDFENIQLRESVTVRENNLASLLVKLRHKNGEDYASFEKIIKKMIPSFSSIEEIDFYRSRDSKEQKIYYYLTLQEVNLRSKLSMSSLSTGDLKTLFLLGKIIDMPKGSLLVIEEIENAMHHHRVSQIAQFLERISIKKDVQLLFTTHSSKIIDSVAPEKLLLVYKDNDHGSTYNRLCTKNMLKTQKFLDEGGTLSEYIEMLSQ